MTAFHLKRGQSTEDLALRHLQTKGLELICRNFSSRLGELDLVMMDGNELVFVEVRYRKSSEFGSAVESVDFHKQSKLRKAAELFMQKMPDLEYVGCRFDVIGVTGKQVEWIRNAF